MPVTFFARFFNLNDNFIIRTSIKIRWKNYGALVTNDFCTIGELFADTLIPPLIVVSLRMISCLFERLYTK